MTFEYIFLLNILMISRLIYIFSDEMLSIKEFLLSFIIFIVGILVYQINVMFYILIILLILDYIILYVLERKKLSLNIIRSVNFLILALIFSFLFKGNYPLMFNPKIHVILDNLNRLSVFSLNYSRPQLQNFNTILFGILLIANEANLILRSFFDVFRLNTEKKKYEKGVKLIEIKNNEYRAGRIIGIIERLLMYFFLLYGEIGSIAFIVAAKGFARFKDLDNREFAEYVLIGTLLSTLMSILISQLILSML